MNTLQVFEGELEIQKKKKYIYIQRAEKQIEN